MNYSNELRKAYWSWFGWSKDCEWELPPINRTGLGRLDRDVAEAAGVDTYPQEIDIDGSLIQEQWGTILENFDGHWNPTGPGPLAWGQALAAADAVDGDPWYWLWRVAGLEHKGAMPAESWWLGTCPPAERGPWLCLAIAKTVDANPGRVTVQKELGSASTPPATQRKGN